MRQEDLKVGMSVRIAKGHSSGYGGRIGRVVEIGVFETLDKNYEVKGAKVDIQDTFLVLVECSQLEHVAQKDIPMGWSEFDI